MVSIITVNYNGAKDTCELIASLKQHETYPYEVIVVDNASRGDDVELIRKAHPNIRVVASERNRGFAGGNNLGLKYAKGEYLFFLNNDMVVKEAILQKLVTVLNTQGAGAVSPCIRFYYHPEKIQYRGLWGMTDVTLRLTDPPRNSSHREEASCPFVTRVMHGAAMMLSREVVERIGRMTEVYFLFYEEYDWSRRIREAGLEIWCDPTAEVYHKESVSIPKNTPSREFYMTRSRMLFTRRNNKGTKRLLSILYLQFVALPAEVAKNLREKNRASAWAAFRGTWAGLFAKTK